MKKAFKYIVLSFIIFLIWWTYPWIFSAGGVGNIAIYYIDKSKVQFEYAIDSVIDNSSIIGIPDTNIYTLKGTGYEDHNKFIYLIEESDTFVFGYGYSQFKVDWESRSNFRIALTHVGRFPESDLKIDNELFPFQDAIWESRFEQLLTKCNFEYKKE